MVGQRLRFAALIRKQVLDCHNGGCSLRRSDELIGVFTELIMQEHLVVS